MAHASTHCSPDISKRIVSGLRVRSPPYWSSTPPRSQQERKMSRLLERLSSSTQRGGAHVLQSAHRNQGSQMRLHFASATARRRPWMRVHAYPAIGRFQGGSQCFHPDRATTSIFGLDGQELRMSIGLHPLFCYCTKDLVISRRARVAGWDSPWAAFGFIEQRALSSTRAPTTFSMINMPKE